MGEENKQSLLKKHYYVNCPGCKVDELKEKQRGVPIKELVSISIMVLCTALPISSLFPYLYLWDFKVAETEEEIGYYAGYVGSSFMLARALTSILWGMVADRYGRKPVIIIGTSAMVIFNTLFGLSVNYWMAISTRFLLGSVNGLLGPVKAYASEIFREEYQALGISSISAAWGIGLIIGPALGGFLAQPAEKYPAIFSKESIFGRFPYFLPCLCISLFGLVVTVVALRLPETLHIHKEPCEDSVVAVEAVSRESTRKEITDDFEGREPDSMKSLVKNWPLMSSIIVYCIFSLHDMAYTEIFSLWAESPRKDGGLSYSTDNVGVVLVASGLGLLVSQLSLYPIIEKILGPIMVARICGMLIIPLQMCYPYMTLLTGLSLSLLLGCASVVKNILSVSIITSTCILQNKAVDQRQRAAANGISMTAMSFFKAAAPAGAGAIFSWTQKRQDAAFFPGDHMIFFLLNMIEAIGVLMTFKPFLVERQNP